MPPDFPAEHSLDASLESVLEGLDPRVLALIQTNPEFDPAQDLLLSMVPYKGSWESEAEAFDDLSLLEKRAIVAAIHALPRPQVGQLTPAVLTSTPTLPEEVDILPSSLWLEGILRHQRAVTRKVAIEIFEQDQVWGPGRLFPPVNSEGGD